MKRYRSAITGEYVSEKYAYQNSTTTISEEVPDLREIVWVTGDWDWEGVYIDGALEWEGHSLPTATAFEIAEQGLFNFKHKVIDQQWADEQDFGSLPLTIDEVKFL